MRDGNYITGITCQFTTPIRTYTSSDVSRVTRRGASNTTLSIVPNSITETFLTGNFYLLKRIRTFSDTDVKQLFGGVRPNQITLALL